MQKNLADAMPNKIINNLKKKRPYLNMPCIRGLRWQLKIQDLFPPRETYRISSMWFCEYTNAFNYL